MKPLSRHALVFAALLVLTGAGCNKKTESKDVSQDQTPDPAAATPGTADATAPAPGGAKVAAVPGANSATTPGTPPAAGTPEDNSLLALLPAADRARYEAWAKKYNLSFQSGVLDQDSDGDGYTNREEFINGTNPRDPNSLPGVMEGVTVKAVNEVQVPLILLDVKGEKARIKHTDDSTLEEIAQGSQPRGTAYKVKGLKHEIKADKHGVLTDVSNVTLENAQTKETVTLVRDLPARSSETHAILVGPGGAEQKVRLDDVISLPGQGSKKFKVVDLRPDQVLVEDIETKRPVTIPKR
jgi:hypothetical protein